jgi:ankyrin repeat protein
MVRKKALKKKQQTTLMPHRTQNPSILLERAKSGDSAQAMKAYIDAGGPADVLVQGRGAIKQIPLLHYMALYNMHPHAELSESMRLLIEAGADINALSGLGGGACTALMCASERSECTDLLQAFLQNAADVMVVSDDGRTALHLAATTGRTHNCEVLLATESSLVHTKNAEGCTALMYAASFGS